MKTVLNRAISLVMCLVLVFSTVSAVTFGVSAEEPYSYKTYAQNATKENVHHLMDMVDDVLKEQDIIFEVDQLNIVIDLTSIDAICSTLDEFRTPIKLFKGLLGDLKNLNLDVFDKGMSRAGSGDVKLFYEILELANANQALIEAAITGDGIDLGVVGTVAEIENIKIDLSTGLKEGIVEALFENHENYEAIKADALVDFDRFVYRDIIGLVSKDITVNENTTVNHLVTDVFNILVNNYVIGLVEDKAFSFATLGSEYAKLDTIIQLDGSYDFSKITFTKDKTVLDQINNVLGAVFVEVVPGFKGKWVSGNYTKIGSNVKSLVRYIATESGLIKDVAKKSDEALMLEIVKIIFCAADTNGEKEIYEAIKDTKTLTDAADKIVIQLSGKDYPDGTTYEHVIGDWLIEKLGGIIPLNDAMGNPLAANGKTTVWDALNSGLNFLLIDKNLDAFFGWKLSKGQTYFEKLDIILDYTANDGTADFNSKTYITSLINSLFTVNIQKFVELTAVKALNFAGNESVIKLLYNTVYNLINNWSGRAGITRQTSDYFDKAFSEASLAQLVKALIKTLNARAEGTANLVAVLLGAFKDINENVTKEGLTPTCTANGYAPTKKCTRAECNGIVFSDSNDVIASRGHKYNSGVVTTAPKCTTDGVKTTTCLICKYSYKTKINKLGHKAGAYKTTKAATYKTKGVQVSTCTVCKAKVGTKYLNMLTLSKPSGLKAKALSTSSIKYSWNAVKGAESYVLYYRAGSGKWSSVKTTKTSVTVKKLKAGTTYKFKVVAVAGTNKSKESSTVSSTTNPSAVTIKRAVSKVKKQVVVEWKKLSGVTGYEVQYSTSKKFKSGNKTVKIKKGSTVKTIIKKLKSKKTYYVRVRAYKTVNKVNVYGSYSKVKSVKCK